MRLCAPGVTQPLHQVCPHNNPSSDTIADLCAAALDISRGAHALCDVSSSGFHPVQAWTADADAADKILSPDTPRMPQQSPVTSGAMPRRTSTAALASLEAASDACGISVSLAEGVRLQICEADARFLPC